MIVDTMTLKDVAEYLWKHPFSKTAIENISEQYKRKHSLYKQEIAKWLRKNNSEKIKVFKTLKYKGGNEETLYGTPYTDAKAYINFVFFTVIRYKNRKIVAFKQLYNNKVAFFSWHSIQRYCERFLGDADIEIDIETIGDMLAHNCTLQPIEYAHNDKRKIMMPSTDGSFLCEFVEGYIFAKTFISTAEYFENQAEIDKEAMEILRRHRKEKYNDDIISR